MVEEPSIVIDNRRFRYAFHFIRVGQISSMSHLISRDDSKTSHNTARTSRINSIHQGDCLELLRETEQESVDLVFADPPFNIGYKYDVYEDSRDSSEYLAWSRDWIQGVFEALKSDGTFWLAIGDEYAAELKIEAQKVGFHCRSWVIWYYTFGVNCKNGFSRSHTHLFHFVKNPKKFTFNRINPEIRVKSARELVYADNRANPSGRLPDNTWITRPQDAPEFLSFRPSHDTWFFSRVAGTFKEREGFHGCQMPEQLLARIIRTSSNPQDLVLDPFSGSGTTLCVAKKLARQWVGFELSGEYAGYIQGRLENTNPGDPIDGPEDAVASAPSTVKGKQRKKPFNEETERIVVDSYLETGYPVDYLLCHPELNEQFVSRCLERGIAGSAQIWNRYLLRLRKQGQLPRSTKSPQKVTADQLDQFGFASEIAWRLLSIDYRRTLDDLLCSPEFATEFDRLARQFGPASVDLPSFDLRRVAVSIRKRSHSSRNIAEQQFSEWMLRKKKLDSVSLDDSLAALEEPGVYVLFAGEIGIFASESANMRVQLESLLANENWLRFEADRVGYVAHAGGLPMKYGLKSALAKRESTPMNCRLLVSASELD